MFKILTTKSHFLMFLSKPPTKLDSNYNEQVNFKAQLSKNMMRVHLPDSSKYNVL